MIAAAPGRAAARRAKSCPICPVGRSETPLAD
jgi:hypothetical protein